MNHNERKEKLKQIIISLHKEGKDVSQAKNMFKESFENVSGDEIAGIEQELINEGSLTAEQITKLCDVHVSVFKESLPECIPEETAGHPLHTYQEENRIARKLIEENREKFRPLKLIKLTQIVTHYTRLENQLFPALESKGFSGPSTVMWAKHDEIRAMIKKKDTKKMEELITAIDDMIDKEERILFPTALEKLNDEDWSRVKQGEEEIGFAFGVKPGNEWKPVTIADIHKKESPLEPKTESEALNLNTGKLPLEVINQIFKSMPIDISFVNDKDEVMYYSDTKERIFPRSPGVIGRNVQNCHPAKSHHIVNRILESFKAGEKDVADFVINLKGNWVQIKYFAIRSESGKYLGCLEFSQDITEIKNIKEERRLLDWDKEN
ncbi:MAG: DUF438 domain-containing protein [Promethearchaeota archaeon]